MSAAPFFILSGIVVIGGAIGAIVGVHLLTLLKAQGIGLAAAVALGALVGPAQVGGRVIEMAGRGRHHPLWTMSAALGLIAIGIGLMALAVGPVGLAIILYGAGNGVFSIAKGTLPLALFDPHRYASLMGRLARPSLIAQAVAPTAGALLLDQRLHLDFRRFAISRLDQCGDGGGTVMVSKALAMRQ